ncbi:MAG: tRNA (cytidine(56)-2'-O)-methyltransferase [Candidatus Diapherotrites archaeon]|uniref:tRNA (cytidine(56)-2'-O)-methyltransferase n=1 Tax=Candidatus Iainarchaeum sp. TaxID=3101447 RepID=A0A8T4L722_9ARCH|nr:tRNA (cytidine(56)-2'-O)-methyltransferase [Candidatus Diapherotrites archaeon]
MPPKDVIVLRYGHRPYRDQRVTTHCCLVARAFGASKILVEGETDPVLLETVKSVNATWGQGIEVGFCPAWKPVLRGLKMEGYAIVHLTMYGLELEKTMPKIRNARRVCVVIGSQKVERGVYELADWNLAVGSTPHSEIAALAVFLHELFKGRELRTGFAGARLAIQPNACGKQVVRADR